MKKIFLKYKIGILLVVFLMLPQLASALIPLPVNQGGTGVGTITGIIQGNGTSPFSAITVGSGLNFSAGTLSATNAGTVTSVSGTTNRITSTGGATPVIDISGSYVGQSSLTTVGTLTSGAIGSGFTAIPNSALANSTISGISLGSNLNALTATDSTLTFSGSYNGSTARTVGLNLANANTWTGQQTFNTTAPIFGTITGSTQCLHVNTSGLLSGTGSDCGSGSGMAIGGTVTSGTAGSILFVGSGPVLAQDNTNLFWDSGNHQIVWPKFNSLSTTSQAAVGVTDANLVSLWHFDAGTGTSAVDSIGSTNLTLNSASWTTTNQLVGTAAATDYASATVTIPLNSAWTIMGWIYSTDYSQQKEIFASSNSVGDGSPSFAVGTTSGTRQLQLYAAGNFATTNPMAISDGLWYHIAVTFDGTSTYKLYLDGVLNATRTATPSGNNSKLFIGSGFFGTLSGVRIDEWAYFNAALTQAQVQKYPLVSYINKGGIFSEKFLIKDSNDFIYVNANPSNGFFTISGNSDNTARGPLVIKSKATGSGLGVGFNIDASPLTNGKNYSFVSTGNLSSPGAGAFAVYDSTAGAYPWVMLSSYHLNFATNFYNDIAQVAIIPTSSSTVGNIIRGASSQTADLTQWQSSSPTTLSVVDKNGYFGIGAASPVEKLSVTSGHIGQYGSADSVSSCGTSPSISGAGGIGQVTEGSIATGCVITFGTVFQATPSCTISSDSGLALSFTKSTTALTITNIGALSGTTIDYQCFAHG